MLTGWKYRLVSVVGVIVVTAGAVAVANHPFPQRLFTTHVPVFNRLEVTVLSGSEFYWALILSIGAVMGCLAPLYRPHPRRVLDTVFFAQKRVLVAGSVLATLGYFNYTYRLPRATLVMTFGILSVAVPAWFVWIRRRPGNGAARTLVVGDDLDQIDRIAPLLSVPVHGYLCPSVVGTRTDLESVRPAPDGGIEQTDADRLAANGYGNVDGLARLAGSHASRMSCSSTTSIRSS